jgi:hypothetical protein
MPMTRASSVVLLLAASFAQTGGLSLPATAWSAQRGTPNADVTVRAVTAANAFLATLDKQQRSRAQLELRPELRSRWSNLPTGTVMQVDRSKSQTPLPRNGIKLGDLTSPQSEAVLALLRATLSAEGFQKVTDIVNSDEEQEKRAGPTRAPTSAVKFGRNEYYVAILGSPSPTAPWMLQFGGHHLAINLTFAGRSRVLTPSHLGAQPTMFTLDTRTVRPLGDELDKAIALINALDPSQQKQAMLGYAVADTVLAAGEDGKVIQPEGVKASAFTAAQQKLLLDLIGEWVNVLDDAEAAARMREISGSVGDTYVAWSGPTTKDGSAYFRIQGPTVIIEYAPQALRQLGPDGRPEHVHTIYRDPTNDYGRKFTAK